MSEVDVVTVPAVTVNVAEVAPAATATLVGTVAAEVFELERDTVTPPVPAASVSVTVPVPVAPLAIVLGLTDTLLSAAGGGVMAIPKVASTVEYEAVKVTGVEVLTVPAVTVNVVEVDPCGIVTLDGTLAAAVLELLSDTTAPPLPAAAVSVTVPVAVCPPEIVAGLTETLLRAPGSGLIVTPNVAFTPEYEAVTVAVVEELTVPAVSVKVPEVEPCATVRLEGTLAAVALELESETTTPPLPAASVRVTVPVPVRPLVIVLGLTETVLSAAGGGSTVIPKVVLTLA